jgi:hypothetical protein
MDLTRAAWRKASYSNGEGNCIEVASLPDAVAVRDSKDRGPALTFTPAQWQDFTARLRASRSA